MSLVAATSADDANSSKFNTSLGRGFVSTIFLESDVIRDSNRTKIIDIGARRPSDDQIA
jgi:hypothetical protein